LRSSPRSRGSDTAAVNAAAMAMLVFIMTLNSGAVLPYCVRRES
jgi:hypothetical protein